MVKVNRAIDMSKFQNRVVGNRVKIVNSNQNQRPPVRISNDPGNMGRPMVNKYSRNTPDIKSVPVNKGAGPGPLRKKGRDPPSMQRNRSLFVITGYLDQEQNVVLPYR